MQQSQKKPFALGWGGGGGRVGAGTSQEFFCFVFFFKRKDRLLTTLPFQKSAHAPEKGDFDFLHSESQTYSSPVLAAARPLLLWSLSTCTALIVHMEY